ncbi:MAG: hypothetical protein A2035_01370 [Nitrospirae bacterium GWA2_42_11]|nr:MAG: hypothetical protein A2035_01370 [Nitrospirae bacterium GWA2_42_11]
MFSHSLFYQSAPTAIKGQWIPSHRIWVYVEDGLKGKYNVRECKWTESAAVGQSDRGILWRRQKIGKTPIYGNHFPCKSEGLRGPTPPCALMLILTALSLFKTLASIATPCSVNAYGREPECFIVLNR